MRILSAAFAIWIAAAAASAHPLAPALLELDEKVDGTVDVVWKTSALKVPGSEVKPVLPAECPLVGTPRLDEGVDSVTAYWTVDCAPGGLVGRTVSVTDLDITKTDVLLRLSLADSRSMNFVLRSTEPSVVIPEKASPLDVAIDYARLGVEHILGGPDHLLFVFGLVLLVPHLRTLIKTVTAFTVGHSVTLTLAVLGFVTYPTGLIELLIAISVFLLAVELARDESSPPGLMDGGGPFRPASRARLRRGAERGRPALRRDSAGAVHLQCRNRTRSARIRRGGRCSPLHAPQCRGNSACLGSAGSTVRHGFDGRVLVL